jgi:hypothetical protein
MAVTIETLKEKVTRLQQDLAELSAALDELAKAPAENGPPSSPTGTPLAGMKLSDPEALLSVLDKAFAEMGIDVSQPAPSAEEVQQLMLSEGIKPEDNIGSRAIIEARDE